MTDVGRIKAEDSVQMRYDVQTTLEESMADLLGRRVVWLIVASRPAHHAGK